MEENPVENENESDRSFVLYNNWKSMGGSYMFDLFTIRYETHVFANLNVLCITVLNFEFRFYIKKVK